MVAQTGKLPTDVSHRKFLTFQKSPRSETPRRPFVLQQASLNQRKKNPPPLRRF